MTYFDIKFNPIDLYTGWAGVGGAQNATLSRDINTTSPVGNSPLKMVTNAGDPYTITYGNSSRRNLDF